MLFELLIKIIVLFELTRQICLIFVNKANAAQECGLSHYWYFFDKGFKCEPYRRNCCDDLMQKAMNFNDVAIFFCKRK